MKTNFLHQGANFFGLDLHEKDLEKVMAYVLDQAEGNKWLDQ
jgi:hypothetical protein